MKIYHITTQHQWDKFTDTDHYVPDDYGQNGFIHCCEVEQLEEVLQRYFIGKENLLLLHVDEDKLTSPVKREPSTGGKLYPHVYGGINRDAVLQVETLGKVL